MLSSQQHSSIRQDHRVSISTPLGEGHAVTHVKQALSSHSDPDHRTARCRDPVTWLSTVRQAEMDLGAVTCQLCTLEAVTVNNSTHNCRCHLSV
jgi:hypothetical protein